MFKTNFENVTNTFASMKKRNVRVKHNTSDTKFTVLPSLSMPQNTESTSWIQDISQYGIRYNKDESELRKNVT